MKSLSFAKGDGEKRTAHDGCLDDQNKQNFHLKSSAVRERCNKTAVHRLFGANSYIAIFYYIIY